MRDINFISPHCQFQYRLHTLSGFAFSFQFGGKCFQNFLNNVGFSAPASPVEGSEALYIITNMIIGSPHFYAFHRLLQGVMARDFLNESDQGEVIKNIFPVFLYMTQVPPKNIFQVEKILQNLPKKLKYFQMIFR